MVLAVLAAAFFLFFWQRYVMSGNGVTVVAERNGEVIGSYPLDHNQRLAFTDDKGKRNVRVIQEGKAYMEEADCPDKLCVKQKAIERNGESIICLPHKLVIRIAGGEEGEVDAVAWIEEGCGYEEKNG